MIISSDFMEIDVNIEEKQRILVHAREKFFKDGFYKTTIDEIAADLFISKNTIYKYFPNKDALVMDVFTDFMGKMKLLVGNITNSDENAVKKFVNLIHILSNHLASISDKFFKDMQVHVPHLWHKIDETRKQLMQDRLGKLIEQGKKEELFYDYPTEIVLTVFITSLRSVVNPDFLMNSNFAKNDAIKYTFRILLGGILTKKGMQIFKKLKLPQ